MAFQDTASYSSGSFADLYDQSSAIIRAYSTSRGEDIRNAVLTAAIEHLPMGGKVTMMRDIVETDEDLDSLEQLGQHFIDSVLKPMKFKRSPPSSSMSPSPSPDAHQAIDTLIEELGPSSRCHELKEVCLRRDGFRCVASGTVDGTSYTAGRVRHEKHEYPLSPTECAHLIPFALGHVEQGAELENAQERTNPTI